MVIRPGTGCTAGTQLRDGEGTPAWLPSRESSALVVNDAGTQGVSDSASSSNSTRTSAVSARQRAKTSAEAPDPQMMKSYRVISSGLVRVSIPQESVVEVTDVITANGHSPYG
jgi:hypothetical protein